jgi:catecholate siderophore receptor
MRFGTRGLNHAATLGLELASEQQVAPTLGGLGTRNPVDIYMPNPDDTVLGFAPAHTGATTDGQTDTVALYGFDTVELGRKWQASGGFRLERYQTDFRSVDAAGLVTNIDADDTLFSGKAGLLYRLGPDGNVYVSYGTSLTPPGSANFGLSSQANNANNPNVEPQFSRNFEVGTKWDVAQGRLGLTAAVFNTRNENVIYTIDALASPPLYNQDDVQKISGVSFGSVGRITNQWEIFANITYLDSSFDTQLEANQGNRLTNTPSVAASVWTTYRLPRGFAVGGGVRGTDKVYINAANTIIAPGYALVDALVEKVINRNLTLRVNLYNLTNEAYIRNVNNNGGRYNPGQPRSVIVTTDWAF